MSPDGSRHYVELRNGPFALELASGETREAAAENAIEQLFRFLRDLAVIKAGGDGETGDDHQVGHWLVQVVAENPPGLMGISLLQAWKETLTGDFSGQVITAGLDNVSPKTAARLLADQGSDPEFFRLDEDGNSTAD